MNGHSIWHVNILMAQNIFRCLDFIVEWSPCSYGVSNEIVPAGNSLLCGYMTWTAACLILARIGSGH